MSSKSFDWKSLQKFLDPQAADDFSRFLDSIPGHAGRGALIAAGIAWGAAAALGLFTMMQSKQLTETRAQLQSSEALKPVVPTVSLTPAGKDDVKSVAEEFSHVYPDLTVSANGEKFTIQSKKTSDFAEFREALGHVVNGGADWKISIDTLCIGRECKGSALNAALKIQKLKIDKPSS